MADEPEEPQKVEEPLGGSVQVRSFNTRRPGLDKALRSQVTAAFLDIRGKFKTFEDVIEHLVNVYEQDMVQAYVRWNGPWRRMGREESRGAWRTKLIGWLVEVDVEWRQDQGDLARSSDAETHINHLRTLERHTRKLLDDAIIQQQTEVNQVSVSNYRSCYEKWKDAEDRLHEELAKQHDKRDSKLAANRRAKGKAYHRQKLEKEYEGRGPVYKMLCAQAAAAYAAVEDMQKRGKTFGHPEHDQAHDRFLASIAQIQKHTESMKTEVLEEKMVLIREEFGERILRIVERHVGNQPLLMKRILDDIESGGEGNVIEGKFAALPSPA